VIDVGCGPGALTAELIKRVAGGAVWAVDPSERFVAAVKARCPAVRTQEAAAERLPFGDGCFDVALAQLVVHFMTDPVKGIGEMKRVTATGGTVAACVWDHAGGRGPLALFWTVARELDPDVDDESRLAGVREGHLGELFQTAGFPEIEQDVLQIDVEHSSFEEWWEPFLLGVGPAGSYVTQLDSQRRARLREGCRDRLPGEPFVVSARAWAARAVA
jgi:SAM-dependent methyltransferase